VTPPLTGTGIWSAPLRYGDRAAAADAAAELEELGYTALWLPDVGGNLFGSVERLLQATSTTVIATGILNIWVREPAEAAAEHARLIAAHGDRLLIGLGVSHQSFVDLAEAGRYRQPLARMREYLDGLDAAAEPLPVESRVLAALRPKMLELARTRTAGAHPYLVPPAHTAIARDALGPGAQLLPEQAVVLETDPERARTVARLHLATYLGLPNYAGNWQRLGFTDDDIADGEIGRAHV